MGKSKRAAHRAEAVADADDDVRSTGSHDTVESRVSSLAGIDAAWGADAEPEMILEPENSSSERLDEILEMLLEKRSTTREAGLAKLIQALLRSNDVDFLVSVRAEALPHLLSTLRNPSAAEGAPAVRAVAILCLLFGPDADELFPEVEPLFRRLVTRCEHHTVRVAATRALALACFARGEGGGGDDSAAGEALAFLGKVFRRASDGLPVPDDVCAAALEGWGLLASAERSRWVTRVLSPRQLNALSELLHSPRYSVRAAAAENLALLHELRLAAATGDDDADGRGSEEDGSGDGDGDDALGEHEESDGAAAALAEREARPSEVDDEDELDEETVWAEVAESVKALAGDTNKRMSKEGRKQQRHKFREIVATITEDELPTQTLSVLNGSLDVNGWAQVKQVAAVRACLLGGFQLQLQCNRSLRALLGVEGVGGTGGPKQMRGKGDGASRARTNERTRSRASRQSAKDHYLFADDDR